MADEFTFTMPPVACLFGKHEHVERLYMSSRGSGATFVMATVLLAADAAAQAIAGRGSNDFPHMTCDLGTREHQATRAALHAFLMSTSPDVVSTALWKAVEDNQRREFRSHHSTGLMHQRCGNAEAVTPYVPSLLVLHLADEAEFMLVRQRAPAAIAVEIVERHPQSEGAQPREGWPPRCTRIGSRPDVPSWVGPEAAAEAHQRTWAELVRQRIKSLACSSLAVEITLNNKEAPRV